MKNDLTAAIFGITSYDFIAGGTGSGDVNKAYTVDLMTGLTNAGLKVTKGLSELYTTYKTYQEHKRDADRQPGGWAWGKEPLPEMAVSRNMIDKQSLEADIAIITLGRQSGKYTLHFSANVEDSRATATYTQAKAQSIQCHDVMKPNREL